MIRELLPLTERKLKILLVIYMWGSLHNNRIAQLTGIDKQNVSLHVKKFKKENIIFVHRTLGKITEYALNEDVLKELSSLLERYRKDLLFSKYPILQKVSHYVMKEMGGMKKLYLIGSYAQDTATKKSDIDLLIVSKKITALQVKKLTDEIFKLYKVKTDILLYTLASFEKEKKSNSPFYKTTFNHKKDYLILYDNY